MLTAMQVPYSFAESSGDGNSSDALASVEYTGGTITGFPPLASEEYRFTGEPSEAELTSCLPEYLDVFMFDDDYATQIPVSWEIVEDYEGTEFYFYSARPVWDDSYTLAADLDPDLDVPWITLFREPSDQELASGEPEADIPTEDPEQIQVICEGQAPEQNTADDPAEQQIDAAGDPGEVMPAFGTDADTDVTEDEAVTEEAPMQETSPEEGGVSLFDILTFGAEESHAASLTNAEKIYRYLTKTMGLNMAAACGVMTNLYAESGMQPNNLENLYNARYGLSDSEYTKRVNKGKKNNGKYTSGYGTTRYFTKDYSGYGICQWTSLGRREALLKKAVKKGVSIANLNMQLEYLTEELQNSYPQVWATLEGVPNTSAGAYLAAYEFCMAFEIPANTSATAASRAKTALSTYWKSYSGKSVSASGTSFMGICGYSYPEHVKKGKGLTVSGHVITNYRIKSVSVKIIDSKKRVKYSSSRKPDGANYSLYNFDSSMLFGKLNSGTYTYVITAKDTAGKSITVKRPFKVTKKGETVSARGCNTKSKTYKLK